MKYSTVKIFLYFSLTVLTVIVIYLLAINFIFTGSEKQSQGSIGSKKESGNGGLGNLESSKKGDQTDGKSDKSNNVTQGNDNRSDTDNVSREQVQPGKGNDQISNDFNDEIMQTDKRSDKNYEFTKNNSQAQSTADRMEEDRVSAREVHNYKKSADSLNLFDYDKKKVRKNEIITRLNGLGTYCFANSSIQCLNNIPDVKEYFTSLEIKNEEKEIVTSVFKYVFLIMGHNEDFVLENSIQILSDSLRSLKINYNRHSCPLDFICDLLSQIYRETTNAEEFRNINIVPMDGIGSNLEGFDNHPLKKLFGIKHSVYDQRNMFLYTLSVRVDATEKLSTSELINNYFLNNSYDGELPKVLILRTLLMDEGICTSKELAIDNDILIDGMKYKLSSWIVAPDRGSFPHFYAIIRDENNNFIECNDRKIGYYDKKEVEDSVYLVFYERE